MHQLAINNTHTHDLSDLKRVEADQLIPWRKKTTHLHKSYGQSINRPPSNHSTWDVSEETGQKKKGSQVKNFHDQILQIIIFDPLQY